MIVILLNTVKEFIRNKIIYSILGLSIFLVIFSLVIANLALSESNKIVVDFSLTIIELFGLITTLFLGSYLLNNEISKSTILLVLSKNPNRSNFIIGKYLGFGFIIFMLYFILSIAFILVLLLNQISFDIYYIISIILSYIKILVVLSFIIFFSTFVSPFINLLSTLAIYIVAHTFAFVKFYVIVWKKFGDSDVVNFLINLMYYILPNFHDLSMKEYLLSPYIGQYTTSHIGLTILSNLLYIGILLYFSIIIFNKKEI